MKKLILMMLLMCSVSAWAQDVIVKKDGSLVVCRILEVTQTEVVYQKWDDKDESKYIVNQGDLTSIQYKDGTKRFFESTAKPIVQVNQPKTDDELLKMANHMDLRTTNKIERKIKKLKRWGWTLGGLMMATGAGCVIGSVVSPQFSVYNIVEDYLGSFVGGFVIFAGGAAITTGCVVRANKLKRSLYDVNNSALYRQDFKLKNGSSIATGVDILQDNTLKNSTLGIGLSYNF